MTALVARRNQFVNAIRERDEAQAQRNAAWADVWAICTERDEAIHRVENREAARIRTLF
jgi:hypothetical protein